MPFFSSLRRLFPTRRKTLTPSFRSYLGNQRFSRDRRPGKTLSGYQAPTTRIERRAFRKYLRLKSVAIGITTMAAIGGFAYLLLWSPILAVQKIEVVGESETQAEQKVVQTALEKYLNTNLILVPSHSLTQKLFQEFPYLSSIEVDKIPFHTLKAKVTAYPHTANLEIIQEDKESRYYVVNSGGLVAVENNTEEGLPWIQVEATGLDIPETIGPHEVLISAETLENFLTAKTEFEAKFNLEITEIRYLKRARELHLKTERGFWIWLDTQKPVDLQLLKLKRAMSDLNIYDTPLQYIDLRISGQNSEKVIYKAIE